jgi:hypothetical protein
MQLNAGVYGLAWAQSIVAAIEVVILFAVMSSRIPQLFDAVFIHAIARMLSAVGFMSIISYISVKIFELTVRDQSFLATFPKFAMISIISLGSYVYFCKLLNLPEVDPVLRRLSSLTFGQLGTKK